MFWALQLFPQGSINGADALKPARFDSLTRGKQRGASELVRLVRLLRVWGLTGDLTGDSFVGLLGRASFARWQARRRRGRLSYGAGV